MDSSSVAVRTSDQGQKEAFLNELSQFLSYKGRNLCRAPNLAGRIIDLHDLYNTVTSAGGYHKVMKRGQWEDFLDGYGYPAVSSTLAYGLQKIYQLYLEEYERVHFFGDDEPQPFSRSYNGGYRKYRYAISDIQRLQANLNMLKPAVSNYDRVVLSLESCLPNEIDFSVNACTLLSGESRHVLRLPQCKRIIDALLMHAGVVSEGPDSYWEVLEELQNKTKHNYQNFWRNSISKKSVIPTLLSSKKPSANLKTVNDLENEIESNDATAEQGLCMRQEEPNFAATLQSRLQDVQDKGQDETFHESAELSTKRSKWSELFHGHRSLGVEDYEGQRVLQIALVLLNLSFEDFNVILLARHPSLIRFVFLCIHSEYSCLRQTGLDILSNISSHMQLLHLQFDMMAMVFDTINSAVLSHDKFERIRGFEILGNICRTRPNVDHVCVSVADDAYDAAVENLMINDVEVLLAAIEALYRLSKLGEATCTKILFVKGCIDILVCLMMVNVRTFGPEKLAEIRIARKIMPEQRQQVQQHQQPSSYHMPPQQPQHLYQHNAALVQRQINLQQQTKIGSVHQAQPTFAAVAPSAPVQVPTTATSPNRPPLPQQQPQPTNPPVEIQPSIDPTPVPSPTPVSVSLPQQTTPSQPQKEPLASPSTTTPPLMTSVAGSLPPGVEPTYTHSEKGTVPPVFHYMPAPPGEIVQDNSPESFTQLWIWATYESQVESYIPRVDIYCEYLASSNRYGRQGKTEILSATDFGKCLKQIFPQASSRLFNQGRGQPQYHIAGIKKRATPLPVPGYQLKDSTSVFSSELEYEKIPETKPVTVPTKTQPSATQMPRPAATPPSVSQPAASVPIQQLQFQPVLIVSTVPGTNNVTLVPGAQLTAPISQALAPGTIDQAAIAIQNVVVPPQVCGSTTVSVALTNTTVAAGTEIVVPGSQMPNLPPVAPATQTVSSEAHMASENEILLERTVESPNNGEVSEEKQACGPTVLSKDSVAVTESDSLPSLSVATHVQTDASQSLCGPESTLADSVNSNCTTDRDETVTECGLLRDANAAGQVVEEHQNLSENGLPSCVLKEENHASVMNGYIEPDSTLERDVSEKSKSITEEPGSNVSFSDDMSNAKVTRPRSKDCEPMVNGFDGCSGHGTGKPADPAQEVPVNSTNCHTEKKESMNGETEAAVNSILDPSDSDEIFKMEVSGDGSLSSSSQSEMPIKSEDSSLMPHTPDLNSMPGGTDSVPNTVEPAPSQDTLAGAVTPITNDGTSTNAPPANHGMSATTQNETSALSQSRASEAMSGVTSSPTAIIVTSGSQTASPVTPTNPIPHSALNQRLKDTITRRKNFQHTPTSTPANILPSSVMQQYSYKQPSQDGLAQQIIPITPQQLQHQYTAQRGSEATSNHLYQTTQQVGVKRQYPTQAMTSAPAAKIPRLSHPQYTPTPTYSPQYHHHNNPSAQRQPMAHRTPAHPQMQSQQHMPPRPQTPIASPQHPTAQPKPKPPIDLMAPNASLLVLYRNVGKVSFANHMDEKEDAISKSVRLTASLILMNIARHSDLGRSLLQKHEDHLANIAMSQMDCSPIAARLLSELDI